VARGVGSSSSSEGAPKCPKRDSCGEGWEGGQVLLGRRALKDEMVEGSTFNGRHKELTLTFCYTWSG
jgi:hypothetical protein